VFRDLEKTLTDQDANVLRDRIYGALHQGTEFQWIVSPAIGPKRGHSGGSR
jgi:phenylalanyl-tRNA synthetase alpha chain